MKRFILCLIIIMLVGFTTYKRVVPFVWVNPYTNTDGFSYIDDTVRAINDGLQYAKFNSGHEGLKFSYIFQNVYGSGFLNNNPIPNDLDYALGINLGRYVFDGSNSQEIAESVINKMESFQYLFNVYVNSISDRSFYIDKSQIEILSIMRKHHRRNINAVSDNLVQALSGKGYVKYTKKIVENNIEIDLPYIMRKNEVLIEDYDPIMLYSDKVLYNKDMKRYIRSISIIPEFFVTINYQGKDVDVEIVPESFMGERMQLSRRFYASSAYAGLYSKKFLKNLEYLNDDQEYLSYRMLSLKRHLQEISNIQVMQDRPVKMLKRIMQTADIASPLIDKDVIEEINITVAKNMNNKDIQLLNEYSNICVNVFLLMEHPSLYLRLLNDGKIQDMQDVLISVCAELEARGNVKNVDKLKEFAEKTLNKQFLLSGVDDVALFKANYLETNYKEINDIVNQNIYLLIQDKNKIDKYIVMFNDLYKNAGYHRVFLYWLDKNTIGILKDDFTKDIKDLKKFAQENDLADVNYKLIDKSQAPLLTIRYGVWARYNSSDIEQQNFEKMNKAFLDDKKNFNIKTKFVF